MFLEQDIAVAVGDLVDDPGVDQRAAVGEHGVPARHRQRGQRGGAQRHRQVRRQLGFLEAELADVLAREVHADGVQQAHRDQVARLHQRLAQAHRAAEAAAVVLRRPGLAAAVAEHHRCVEHDRGRVEALLERGRVQERLEAGAWLAARLGGAVELVAGVAEAADHGAQRAVVGVQRHQRGLAARDLGDLPFARLVAFLDAHQVAALEQGGGAAPGPAAGGHRQHQLGLVGEHHGGAAVAAGAGDDAGQHPALRVDAAQMAGQRRRIGGGRDVEMLFHSMPAVAAIVDDQALAHGMVGGGLQGRIDAGVDVVALVQHVAAEARDHFLAHQLGHVRGLDLDRALVRRGVHRHRLGRLGLGRGDEAQRGHAAEHIVVAALLGALGVADRVAAGGELGDAGQRGHLVQAQLVELLAVVVLGGGGDAVGAVAEEALVEIQLEDLVLGQLGLDLARQQDLRQLAGVAVFRAQEELAGHLLGDGGAARHALVVGGGQQPHRAGDALVVDPTMLVEPGVLGGQEGLLQPLRHVLHGDGVAPGLAEQRHQLAVAGVDVHRLLQFDLAQGLHVRELGGDDVVQPACHGGADQAKEDEQDQRPAQPTTKTGHRERFRLQISWAQSIEYAGERLGPVPGMRRVCCRRSCRDTDRDMQPGGCQLQKICY
ncbi:hypothetical protein NB706_002813 [Xanthomonas sacchari]|nr:hypothetical protein [Xanthomonas sacchari]